MRVSAASVLALSRPPLLGSTLEIGMVWSLFVAGVSAGGLESCWQWGALQVVDISKNMPNVNWGVWGRRSGFGKGPLQGAL